MAILPQLVTETSFTLTWQPPSFEGSNGVIRQYIIQVLEVDTGITFMEISNLTELTLEGLHPFYSYSCRIAAETIGVGPFSNPVTVQLNEDGKGYLLYNYTELCYSRDLRLTVFTFGNLPLCKSSSHCCSFCDLVLCC